jgi:hypothetical protein
VIHNDTRSTECQIKILFKYSEPKRKKRRKRNIGWPNTFNTGRQIGRVDHRSVHNTGTSSLAHKAFNDQVQDPARPKTRSKETRTDRPTGLTVTAWMCQWVARLDGRRRRKAYVNWTADSILKAVCLDNGFISIMMPNRLMLFGETSAVYWENCANTQMHCAGKMSGDFFFFL